MHPDWARSLRDQCKAAAVPFFFKQWGSYMPIEIDWASTAPYKAKGNPMTLWNDVNGNIFELIDIDGEYLVAGNPRNYQDHQPMKKVGKSKSGHLLDGVAHHAFPASSNFQITESSNHPA